VAARLEIIIEKLSKIGAQNNRIISAPKFCIRRDTEVYILQLANTDLISRKIGVNDRFQFASFFTQSESSPGFIPKFSFFVFKIVNLYTKYAAKMVAHVLDSENVYCSYDGGKG